MTGEDAILYNQKSSADQQQQVCQSIFTNAVFYEDTGVHPAISSTASEAGAMLGVRRQLSDLKLN